MFAYTKSTCCGHLSIAFIKSTATIIAHVTRRNKTQLATRKLKDIKRKRVKIQLPLKMLHLKVKNFFLFVSFEISNCRAVPCGSPNNSMTRNTENNLGVKVNSVSSTVSEKQ